ncbi:NAD(P)/FAD-dependent oxidoreductase [Kribbella monticola]|uniref:NAD(P)/FAD-dependent oxidoreductase n=1 Tax=Kribbella monticola TaxID=2185285 RepID=UPI000DD2EA10|nr:FAD-dependent monooxygenase [Kribbella monticola]
MAAQGKVIVAGGSVAGLLAARAVAHQAASVVVLERERLTDAVAPRGHVPQGRHQHLLLAAGLALLREWFPGIGEELESLGAVPVDGQGAWVYQGGAYRARGDWGPPVLCMTRPLLEHVIRARVAALPGVRIEDGVLVERVVVEGPDTVGGRRVTGVVADGIDRAADLVVDCSGRNSRIAHDLAASGLLAPPVTRIGIDIGYASFQMRRSPGDLDGGFVACVDNPGSFRAGSVLPVENDRWQVTLAGVHGDVPPADEDGMRAFADSLPSPVVGQLVNRCERVSEISTYRFPSSQRRHYEKTPLLPGLVTLGDASSSFDPIYGQGMSSAALQARALKEEAQGVGLFSPELPRRFHRKAARVIDGPWRIAVGGDFGHPATVGARPRGTAQLNGYLGMVIRAAHVSVPVARAFNGVLQLAVPPTVLLRPDIIIRVLRDARRSPVSSGETIQHPRVGTAR